MAILTRIQTTASYRGLPVTVLGVPGEQLLVVAAYGTPQELAIATITVGAADGGLEGVADPRDWIARVDVVAAEAARLREAGDAASFTFEQL